MISRRCVVRMKIPFPSINSRLAVLAHMYICRQADSPRYEFVKCQTLKPYMLTGNTIRHFWDEEADIARNPFTHTTRIDCDKTFRTTTVEYDDRSLTISRRDVCEEIIFHVEEELQADGFSIIALNEDELVSINALITKLSF